MSAVRPERKNPMFYALLLRDIVEITIYSSCIFVFCTWLKTDKTKNIVVYFFAYCAFTLCAWVTQLSTLTPFLFAYAPIALLLFIVLHEKTLQRNLVALCSITPVQSTAQDWLNTVVSSSLAAININKSITLVIEHKDALNYFLDAPFVINADINKNVLDILLSTTSYNEQKMVWITTSGKIRSINVAWVAHQEKREDALFYTLQSDAIILSAHPLNRTFTLTTAGKETKNLSAQQVCIMIKKQLSLSFSRKHKGAYRESTAPEKSLPL
jgi:hypothetical protein